MKLGGLVIKKIWIANIALIASVVLLVISVIVFGTSIGNNITGCIVSLFVLFPISCILVFVTILVRYTIKGRAQGSTQAPPSDPSRKRLSEVAEERKLDLVFCSSCGEQNEKSWKHCSKCGYEL